MVLADEVGKNGAANGATNGAAKAAAVVVEEKIGEGSKGVEELTVEDRPWFEKARASNVQVSVAPGGRWNHFKTYSVIQRTFEIWSFVIVFLVKAWLINRPWMYRGGVTDAKKGERRRELARWLKEGLLRLGPTFIKIGQQFSTRSDLLAQEYIAELSELQEGLLRLGPTFIKIGQQFSIRSDLLAQEYIAELSELQVRDAGTSLPVASSSPPARTGAHRRALTAAGQRLGREFPLSDLLPAFIQSCSPLASIRRSLPSTHFHLSLLQDQVPPFESDTALAIVESELGKPIYEDQVPPFESDTALAIVESELGKPIYEVFERFDRDPIAAASLGQVHRARLQGREVVVKVQRPGLKDLFDIDLKNLRVLAVNLQKIDPKSDGAKRDWVAIYDECASVLYEEIDYMKEGKNADRFRENFKDMDYVKVPKIYWQYTTSQMLVMEYTPGIKINRIDALDKLQVDRKRVRVQRYTTPQINRERPETRWVVV
ncbi:unnamed protein product [Closterium sp. NIES-64]|nr:unnamed protein product [Closterium sp. NIES-64]